MDELLLGTAIADITPDVGTWLAGFPVLRGTPDGFEGYLGRSLPSQGVHDPLLASVTILEDPAVGASSRCALIALDTCLIAREFTSLLRAKLQACGLRPENVLITASHTHSGPDLYGWWNPVASELSTRTSDAICQAVKQAHCGVRPAKFYWGKSPAIGLFVNRHAEIGDPSSFLIQVLVGRWSDSPFDHNRPAVIFVSLACHPIALDFHNLLLSADFVHPMRECLQRCYPGVTIGFLNGFAGNVDPANLASDSVASEAEASDMRGWGGFSYASRFGRLVAAEVIRACEKATPIQVSPVRWKSGIVALPLRAEGEVNAFLDLMNITSTDLRERFQSRRHVDTEVQVARLGTVSMVALPGEPYFETREDLERHLGGKCLLTIGYANDDVRYIVTEKSAVSGKYNSMATPLAIGTDRILVRRSVELFEEMGEELTD